MICESHAVDLGDRNPFFFPPVARGNACNLTSIINEPFYTVQMTPSSSINHDNPPLAGVQLQFNILLRESQHVSSSIHLWRTSERWITFRKSRRHLTSVAKWGKKKAERYDKIHFGLGDSCHFNDIFSQSISVFQLLCGCMFIITLSIMSSTGSSNSRIDHVLASLSKWN